MKNIIKLSVGALVSSAMWFGPAYAEFSDAGTQYSIATVDRWSDDQINEFVNKANSFACVISKARPDVLPNAGYEVLMSEVECGLEDEVINASGLSNKDTLSSSIMKTSRASQTSNQEGQFWFNSQTDMKFIGNMVIKKAASDLPPYGSWSLSYVMNSFGLPTGDAGNKGQTGDEFTASTSPATGYVDISAATSAEGGGIIMRSYELNDMTRKAVVCTQGGGPSCVQDEVMSSTIQYYDASLANSRILGRTVGTNDQGASVDVITAAKTNATHIYKAVFQGVADGNPALSCTKRDSTWKTVHRYGVFNKSTGVKVSLKGGFGFDFTDGSTASRGFLSPNGAFFDNSDTAFTVAAPTKAITAQNNAATPYTLSWAPGKLSQRVAVSETLPNTGITYFKKGTNDGGQAEVRVVKDGGTFKATYHNLATGAAIANPFFGNKATVRKVTASGVHGIDDHSWMGWMYSPEKRTMVYWDGTATIKFYNEKNASADATLLAGSGAGQYTKLLGTQNASTSLASALPITATNWMTQGTETWNYAESASNAGKGTKFYFTALTPPAGKLARTLYLDINPVGPSAGDKAVMFNFSGDERKSVITPFGSTTAQTLRAPAGSADAGKIRWPFKSLDLVGTVATGTSTYGAANTTLYQWRFGAFGWDNSVVALKADNTVYTLDEPMILSYAHTAAKDMNNTKEIVFVKENGNDHNPAPNLCTVPDTTRHYPGGTDDVVVCSVEPSDFAGKNYKLRYNGKWVDGLPDMEGRASENDSNGFRVTMVNPIAGTIVTNTVGGVITNYVLKPLAVSESFLKEPTFANCANGTPDISFTTVAGFGWDLSKLPSATRVTTPAQLWTSQPAKASLKCTVNSGDASKCIQ